MKNPAGTAVLLLKNPIADAVQLSEAPRGRGSPFAGAPVESRLWSAPNSVRERVGLAPLQVRKAKVHIELNLATKITTRSLATLVGLSPFHFSRAFRDSFGDSPHRHVSKQRVERSQVLMLTTESALANIALECGLCDQAHFGKFFRRLVGVPPGVWRRARIAPLPTNPVRGTQEFARTTKRPANTHG